MWCPGLAALLTQLIFRRSLGGLGWRLGKSQLFAGELRPAGAVRRPGLWIVWLNRLGTFIPDEMAKQSRAQLNIQIHSSGVFF